MGIVDGKPTEDNGGPSDLITGRDTAVLASSSVVLVSLLWTVLVVALGCPWQILEHSKQQYSDNAILIEQTARSLMFISCFAKPRKRGLYLTVKDEITSWS